MSSPDGDIPVVLPDADLLDAAKARLVTLESGPSALGVLGDLAQWAASVRGSNPPEPFQRIRCLAIAADHGAGRGSSAGAVDAVTKGEGAVAILARLGEISVRVIDAGVDSEADTADRIRRRSGSIDREDALTRGETEAAIALGRRIADEEADSGADLLIPAAIGTDAVIPAVASAAVLTGREPIWALGFDATIPDAEWIRRCRIIRDARRRTGTLTRDAREILRTVGAIDLAVITGLLVQSAVRRTPVLIGGDVAAAAALLAAEISPPAQSWWLAPQRSGTSTERVALEALSMEPVSPLELRLGEGGGALAAVPMLRAAVELFAGLTTDPPAQHAP
jgi:nicotinate-nucleotide--dimethylbenzimidazole phosphoribosyltransferase